MPQNTMSDDFVEPTGRHEDVAKGILLGWIDSRTQPVLKKTAAEIQDLACGWALSVKKVTFANGITITPRMINAAALAYTSTDIYSATIAKAVANKIPRYTVLPRVADEAALKP